MNGSTTLREVIEELKHSSSQEDCLRKAHEILTTKYQGARLKTITRWPELFSRDVEALWSKSGFLHCTNLNRLLRLLLLQSGLFTEKDIRTQWTLLWYFSPHQYVQVRVGQQWIDVDLWAQTFGVPFGSHAYGFSIKLLNTHP